MATLDDTAAAALFMLGLQADPTREHMGGIYRAGDDYGRTELVSSGGGAHVEGALKKPSGSAWAALFHNHPLQRVNSSMRDARTRDRAGEEFSPDDKAQARALKLPSYISTPTGGLKRYDPASGETADVLAEFPMDEFRAYLMKRLLGRAPDDPRGLKR